MESLTNLNVKWEFPRWSVIRHLQDIGLTQVAHYARGLTLDLGGHKVRQRGFFRLEKIAQVRRLVMNYETSHSPDIRADAHFIPYTSGVFDTVWSVATLLYCLHPTQVFWEAGRVLRPGGHLVVYEPFNLVAELTGDWQRFTPAGMRHMGEISGLETVEIRSCGGLLAVILQAVNDQFYYRAGRGYKGRVINRALAPFLPGFLTLDARLCQRDADYARYTTGWIYVGRKPGAEIATR